LAEAGEHGFFRDAGETRFGDPGSDLREFGVVHLDAALLAGVRRGSKPRHPRLECEAPVTPVIILPGDDFRGSRSWEVNRCRRKEGAARRWAAAEQGERLGRPANAPLTLSQPASKRVPRGSSSAVRMEIAKGAGARAKAPGLKGR